MINVLFTSIDQEKKHAGKKSTLEKVTKGKTLLWSENSQCQLTTRLKINQNPSVVGSTLL